LLTVNLELWKLEKTAQQGGVFNVAQYQFCDMNQNNGSVEPWFKPVIHPTKILAWHAAIRLANQLGWRGLDSFLLA